MTCTNSASAVARSRRYSVLTLSLLGISALAGCVANESPLNLASTTNTAPPQRPVHAVLAGAPTAQPSQPSVVVTPNGESIGVPARSPQAQVAAAQPQQKLPTPTTELAVVEPQADIGAAEAKIENTVNAASTPTVEPNEVASVENAGTESSVDQTAAGSATYKPNEVQVSSVEPSQTNITQAPKGNFLERLFGNGSAKAAAPTSPTPSTASKRPRPKRGINPARMNGRDDGRIRVASAHQTAKAKKINQSERNSIVQARTRAVQSGATTTALPGVKAKNDLFGIKREDGNAVSGNTQLASVGGVGLLSPNGLRVQHSKVQVHCLKPGVLRILKVVERRYGAKPIITSGYRSPKKNRRAGGARNSQHIYCKAVDIQLEGVSKWELAKFLRSIPGRGGVGTYCRTKSVHIDIGSKRDWHHPCRRSKVKKRKKA